MGFAELGTPTNNPESQASGYSPSDERTAVPPPPASGEKDALQLLSPEGQLTTLVRDPRLRWPDGLSFGPCDAATSAAADCLYVTCSALQLVIGRTPGQIRRAGPYQVYRLRRPRAGYAGHGARSTRAPEPGKRRLGTARTRSAPPA